MIELKKKEDFKELANALLSPVFNSPCNFL